MKTTFFTSLIIAAAVFMSCDKEDTDPANNNTSQTVSIRYDFSSDKAAAYNFQYRIDTTGGGIYYDDMVDGSSWTRTVTAPKAAAPRVTQVVAFPPAAWVTTADQANVSLKIFINGVEKASKTAVMAGADRSPGIALSATY